MPLCDAVAVAFSLRIVLVQPRNPLNIGAAARAMANFGFYDLALVEPYDEAWRQAKSARAGAAVLAQARSFDRVLDAIADCELVIGTTAATGRVPEVPIGDWPQIAARLPDRRCALLFGSEKTGLRVEDISFCQQLARLPTLAEAPSMNLGQAVALCCYELRRGEPGLAAVSRPDAIRLGFDVGGERAIDSAPEASVAERERVVEHFRPILEQIGVFRPLHRASQTRRLREMLLRWHLTPADTRLLLGVARELRRVLRLGSPAPLAGDDQPT